MRAGQKPSFTGWKPSWVVTDGCSRLMMVAFGLVIIGSYFYLLLKTTNLTTLQAILIRLSPFVLFGITRAAQTIIGKFIMGYRRSKSLASSTKRSLQQNIGPDEQPEMAPVLSPEILRFLAILVLFLIVILVRYQLAYTRPVYPRDESAYLFRGVQVIEKGHIPAIPQSPGVAFIHAITYLFVRNHPLGMDFTGRITAFLGSTFLYGVTFIAVRKAFGFNYAILAVGLGLLYFPMYQLGGNSSNLLYGVMIGVLLINLIDLDNDPPSRLLIARLSIFTALATLMRNDGFVIFIVFTPIMVYYLYQSRESLSKKIFCLISQWFLPFCVLIFLVSILSWKTTGQLNPFPSERTYRAFEQGMGIINRFDLEKEGLNPWLEGSKIAADYFGSREENQGNVFLALVRHPKNWLDRIGSNIRDFFLGWLAIHNGHLAMVTLLLSWYGWLILFSERRPFLVVSIGALLSPYLVYTVVTFWRPGYLRMYSPLFLFLIASSLYALNRPHTSFQRWRRLGTIIIAIGLFVGLIWFSGQYSDYVVGFKGVIRDGISLAEVLGGIVIIGIFFVSQVNKYQKNLSFGIISLALILGLWSTSSEDVFSLGWSDKNEAKRLARVETKESILNFIMFNFNNFRGARVCAGDPSLPWYARQSPVILPSLSYPSIYQNFMVLSKLLEENKCEFILAEAPKFIKEVSWPFEVVYSVKDIALIKYHGIHTVEEQETILEDFGQDRSSGWVPLRNNNAQSKLWINNGVLSLSSQNDPFLRESIGYRLRLEQPQQGVIAIKLNVKISPGTHLTVDIDKDGEQVIPRFLSFYPGTGNWEEIIVPIGGRLDSLIIYISEPQGGEGDDLQVYHLEVDWIKMIQNQP